MPIATSIARRYALIGGVLFSLFASLGLYAWQVNHAHWEVGMLRWLQDDGPPGLRPVSIALAVAGTGLPWAALIALIGVALLLSAGLRVAILLVLTAVLQDVGAMIKMVVERGRPAEGPIDVWRHVGSYSFPSGHTLGATLVFGFLFFAIEHCALQTRVKRLLQAACVAWIVLMGIGRMELGAHWPTDVLGAWLLGGLLLLPIIAVLRQPRAVAIPE
jgi:membrane-associated phospholipid phosphatase